MISKRKDYQNLCEQDHSGSIYLLEDNLAEHIKGAKATHLMHQSLCAKKSHKPPCTTFSRSLSLVQQDSPRRTTSLNYQGREKKLLASAKPIQLVLDKQLSTQSKETG